MIILKRSSPTVSLCLLRRRCPESPVLSYIDGLEKEIAKEQNIDSVSVFPDLLKSVNGGILPASSADIALAEKRVPSELLSRFVPSGTMTFAVATLKPGLDSGPAEPVVNSLNTRHQCF